VETIPCPHCGAPVKRVATFCLACDTPISDTERGLSVAEPVVVAARARPLLVAAVVVGVLVLLGGAAYGVLHFVRGQHADTEKQAAADARSAVTLLVRAESGQPGACHKVVAYLSTGGGRHACVSIVGEDPGARLENVRLGTAHLGATTGTVRLTATIVDDRQTHALDRVFDLVQQGAHWRMLWDGKPI
jgi:hypothetical protein